MTVLLSQLFCYCLSPYQKTIAKHLRKQCCQYKKDLRAKLKSVTHIALATDLRRNRVGSYWLCITAHFLTWNFKYKSNIVSFRRFYGRQLSNRLTAFVQKEISNLKLILKLFQ